MKARFIYLSVVVIVAAAAGGLLVAVNQAGPAPWLSMMLSVALFLIVMAAGLGTLVFRTRRERREEPVARAEGVARHNRTTERRND